MILTQGGLKHGRDEKGGKGNKCNASNCNHSDYTQTEKLTFSFILSELQEEEEVKKNIDKPHISR